MLQYIEDFLNMEQKFFWRSEKRSGRISKLPSNAQKKSTLFSFSFFVARARFADEQMDSWKRLRRQMRASSSLTLDFGIMHLAQEVDLFFSPCLLSRQHFAASAAGKSGAYSSQHTRAADKLNHRRLPPPLSSTLFIPNIRLSFSSLPFLSTGGRMEKFCDLRQLLCLRRVLHAPHVCSS